MKMILVYMLMLSVSAYVFAGETEDALLRAQEYYEAGDYDETLNLLLTTNLESDSQANFLIGEVYYQQENEQAVNYYTVAASLGHTQAMNMLGSIYSFGWMGQQDDITKARNWWEKSIANGNYEYAVELSQLYFSDLEDYGKSFAFLTEMKEKNISNERLQKHVHFYLGLHYRKGVGVEQNTEKAAKQFRKAINFGSTRYDALCELYSNGKYGHLDARRALACYREFNNRSDENFDIEIAHLEEELAYGAHQDAEEMPSKEVLKDILTGVWRMQMEFESFRARRLLILGADGKYSLHARKQTTYGLIESHLKGTWLIEDNAIVMTIEEPEIYKGRKAAKRIIVGLSDTHMLIDLIAERHVYKRVDRLSDSDKLLALMVGVIPDLEIESLIIGKWLGKLSMGILDIDIVTEYQKDGAYHATGSYTDVAESIPFEVSGTWVVENGFVIQTILSANPEEILEDGNISRVRVLKIARDQFVYYDVDSGVTMTDKRASAQKAIE